MRSSDLWNASIRVPGASVRVQRSVRAVERESGICLGSTTGQRTISRLVLFRQRSQSVITDSSPMFNYITFFFLIGAGVRSIAAGNEEKYQNRRLHVYLRTISIAEGCSLKLSNRIPKNEPVYLVQTASNNFELFDPSGQSSEVDPSLTLFCPGNKNTLLNSNENSKQLTCDARFQTNVNHLNCTKQVSGDLRMTSRPCSMNNRRGFIYDIGFFVDRDFAKLFEVCYDSENAAALYAFHQLNGKAIKCTRNWIEVQTSNWI